LKKRDWINWDISADRAKVVHAAGAGDIFRRFKSEYSAIAANRWVDVSTFFGRVRDAAERRLSFHTPETENAHHRGARESQSDYSWEMHVKSNPC
jgi:hypothetical protein